MQKKSASKPYNVTEQDLFPESPIIKQRSIGNCFFIAAFYSTWNSGEKGKNFLKNMFRQDDGSFFSAKGVQVKIPITPECKLSQEQIDAMQTAALGRTGYKVEKSPDNAHYIITLSPQKCAEIDLCPNDDKLVETNSAALRYLERISAYFVKTESTKKATTTATTTGFDPIYGSSQQALNAFNTTVRPIDGQETSFAGNIMGAEVAESSNATTILLLKEYYPELPTCVSIPWYGSDGKFTNYHALSLKKVDYLASSSRPNIKFALSLINPHDVSTIPQDLSSANYDFINSLLSNLSLSNVLIMNCSDRVMVYNNSTKKMVAFLVKDQGNLINRPMVKPCNSPAKFSTFVIDPACERISRHLTSHSITSEHNNQARLDVLVRKKTTDGIVANSKINGTEVFIFDFDDTVAKISPDYAYVNSRGTLKTEKTIHDLLIGDRHILPTRQTKCDDGSTFSVESADQQEEISRRVRSYIHQGHLTSIGNADRWCNLFINLVRSGKKVAFASHGAFPTAIKTFLYCLGLPEDVVAQIKIVAGCPQTNNTNLVHDKSAHIREIMQHFYGPTFFNRSYSQGTLVYANSKTKIFTRDDYGKVALFDDNRWNVLSAQASGCENSILMSDNPQHLEAIAKMANLTLDAKMQAPTVAVTAATSSSFGTGQGTPATPSTPWPLLSSPKHHHLPNANVPIEPKDDIYCSGAVIAAINPQHTQPTLPAQPTEGVNDDTYCNASALLNQHTQPTRLVQPAVDNDIYYSGAGIMEQTRNGQSTAPSPTNGQHWPKLQGKADLTNEQLQAECKNLFLDSLACIFPFLTLDAFKSLVFRPKQDQKSVLEIKSVLCAAKQTAGRFLEQLLDEYVLDPSNKAPSAENARVANIVIRGVKNDMMQYYSLFDKILTYSLSPLPKFNTAKLSEIVAESAKKFVLLFLKNMSIAFAHNSDAQLRSLLGNKINKLTREYQITPSDWNACPGFKTDEPMTTQGVSNLLQAMQPNSGTSSSSTSFVSGNTVSLFGTRAAAATHNQQTNTQHTDANSNNHKK